MIAARRRYLLGPALALIVLAGTACATSVPGTAAGPSQFPAATIQFRPVLAQYVPGGPAPQAAPGAEPAYGRPGTAAAGTYIVDEPILDGGDVAQAEAAPAQVSGGWIVRLTLTPDGGATFGRYTTENTGRSVAIIVNGEVVSAPMITGPIRGTVEISGSFTQPDAEQLAARIRGDR